MNTLVTGGAGFIGQHLVRLLAERRRAGDRLAVLDLPAADRTGLDRIDCEWIPGSITDPDRVRSAVAGRNRVFHLAADPSLWHADPEHFDTVNHQGTRHVLAACQAAGVARVVYTSTESIVPPTGDARPQDRVADAQLEDMPGPYCRSKFRAEQAALAFARDGLDVVIVNPTVPVGPGDRNQTPPGRLLTAFLRGRVGGYLPGTINFVDVRDVAEGHALAMERGRPGERYLLCGENFTWRKAFALLSKLTGLPAPRMRVPYPVALAFAWLAERRARWLGGPPPLATVTGVRLTRRPFVFDPARTTDALGWRPRPVRESLADAVRWTVDQGLAPRPPHLPPSSLGGRP